MSTLRIEDILRMVDTDSNPETTKTASVEPTSNTNKMDEALQQVMHSIGQTKTAAAAPNTPANDLVKMAAEMVAIDRDGEIKHAQLVGAAMADAFVARVNQWENAALSSQKTAAVDERSQLEKFAAEQPAAFNSAVQQGYSDAKSLIEKIGQTVWNNAYQASTDQIHKTAALHFVAGWDAMNQLAQSNPQ